MNSFVKTLKATSAADDLVVTWELQKPDPHYSSVFTEGSIEQETSVALPGRRPNKLLTLR